MIGRQLGKCVEKDTSIKVRNKNTNEIVELTMEEFHNLQTNHKKSHTRNTKMYTIFK
jgi:hypothetical protein